MVLRCFYTKLQGLKDYSNLKSNGFEKKNRWIGYENIDIGVGKLCRISLELDEHYWINKDNTIACMVRWINVDKIMASGLLSDEEQFRKSFYYHPRRIFAYSTLEGDKRIITGNLNLMDIVQASKIHPVMLGKNKIKEIFYDVSKVDVNTVLEHHQMHINNHSFHPESKLIMNMKSALRQGYYVK